MTSAIRLLRRLLPPPKRPLENQGDWSAIEEELQIELPDDYKQFIELYGTGSISNFINVYNPFTSNAIFELRCAVRRLEALNNIENKRFDILPVKNGLLAWGKDANGDEFLWHTKGSPSRWPIRVFIKSRTFPYFNVSMTEFLVACIQGKVQYGSLPAVLKPDELIEFIPIKSPAQKRNRKK